jgi:hypothetical protein
VLKPDTANSSLALSSSTDISIPRPGKVVFHRYLGDVNTGIWYGYDAVLHTTHGMNGEVKIQPLSEPPDKAPSEIRAARIVAIQELPSESFLTGQRIAVTIPDAGGGRQIVDHLTIDTDFFGMMHHVIGGMITSFHHHFELHGPPSVQKELRRVE